MKAILEPSHHVLQLLSHGVASKLRDCQKRISSIYSRVAFHSLPEEILASILEYATYHPVAERGWDCEKARSIIASVKAAIKLSSVCSHFRVVALHSPNLWNRICVGMPQDMLTTCVERAGFTGLQIFFDLSIMGLKTPEPREEMMFPFLEFVISLAEVWRRFDYECFPYLCSGNPFPETEMNTLEIMTRNLHATQLSDLSVRYEDNHEDIFREGIPEGDEFDRSRWQKLLHFYSTWTLPALRSMSTINLIPIPFAGSSSIEVLSIKMDYSKNRAFDALALSAFLSTCSVLRKLSLQLTRANVLADSPFNNPIHIRRMEKVEDFSLYLDRCRTSSIEFLMDAVHFPSVTSASFTVVCSAQTNPNLNVQAVFSAPDVFPLLEALQFSVRCEGSSPDQPHPIRLPIRNLPNLKTLHLRLSGVVVEPLLDGNTVPARLSSIFLDDCRSAGRELTAEILRVIKAQGRPDKMQVLVGNTALGDQCRIEGIDSLEQEQEQEVIEVE